ncbi:MAG: aspartyl protease family protein [Phycisphaerae bacterium]|jgi:predicted aspartyl protease
MLYGVSPIVILMLLQAESLPSEEWKRRAAQSVALAQQAESPAELVEAMDNCWRADAWRDGLEVADLAATRFGQDTTIVARRARALWRAGRLEEAEVLLAPLADETRDPVALCTLVASALSRGDARRAEALGKRLHTLRPIGATELHSLIAVHLANDSLGGLVPLLRSCEQSADARNGYPETHIAESILGMAQFFQAVGPRPLNVLVSPGVADMPMLVGFNLPYCQAHINGRGPYRLIVDTGGSITLSLDRSIAEDLELAALSEGAVHGVAGREPSGQALVHRLHIGTIELERVMTRAFTLPAPVKAAADGVIGAGVFADSRLVLDFGAARLTAEHSRAAPGRGEPFPIRIVSDAKLVTPVRLNEQRVLAVLDTGADIVALAPSFVRAHLDAAEPRPLPVAGLGVGDQPAVAITLAPPVNAQIGARTFERLGTVGLGALDQLLSPMLGVQVDALIGMQVFRKMSAFTVDFARAQAWVEWLDAPSGG